MKNALPWTTDEHTSIESNYQRVKTLKCSITPLEICQGTPSKYKGLLLILNRIEPLFKLLQIFYDMPFEEKPDYNYIKNFFIKVIKNEYQTYDKTFDWHQGSTISKETAITNA